MSRNLLRRLRAAAAALTLFSAVGAALPARAAIVQADVAAVHGDTGRSLFGTGKGVVIGVVDAGIDANHPALKGSIIAAKDFTGDRTTNDLKSDGIGHGTGVAGLLVGHDAGSKYYGLVPNARVVNARVDNQRDYTNDAQISQGLFYAAAKGAKVINLSLGESPSTPLTVAVNLAIDYVVEHNHALVVAAAGNENGSAVSTVPGGQYNGITVGATAAPRYVTVWGNSNYSLPEDQRTKPDLLAPGDNVAIATANWERANRYTGASGTSFAAPIVGGVVAQMVGYGQAHGLSTDPMVLKAILMTSAQKVYDFDGSAWTPRHSIDEKDRWVIDQPLDDQQGAGMVDDTAAYALYNRKTDKVTRFANWKLSSLKQGGDYVMSLGHLTAGQRVDATLAWLRHVERNAAGVLYQTVSLADFRLTLYRNGTWVIASDSDVDNVEHLSWLLSQAGDYTLDVHRFGGSGATMENFGLAARVLSMTAADSSARPLLAAAARPAETYPSTGAAQGFVTSVPEPTALPWLLLLAVAACAARRRDRSA